jgi:hypothetical protein
MGGLPSGVTPLNPNNNRPLPPGITPIQQPKPQAKSTLPPGITPLKQPAPQATPTAPGNLDWPNHPIAPIPQFSPGGSKLLPLVDQTADKYGVPRSVARAVYGIESGSSADPLHAGSISGAYGPAQIERANANFDRSNAGQSFNYMMGSLQKAYKKYGDWGLAAMAYNAGGGAIDNWLSKGGTLANVNQMVGENQDVLGYGLRVRGAYMGEQFDRMHRAQQNTQQAAAQDRVNTAVNAAKQELGRRVRMGTNGQYETNPQYKGIDYELQGPMQAIGAYGEVVTGASPILGALAGRHPLKTTYDPLKSVNTSGADAFGDHLLTHRIPGLFGAAGALTGAVLSHVKDIVGAARSVGLVLSNPSLARFASDDPRVVFDQMNKAGQAEGDVNEALGASMNYGDLRFWKWHPQTVADMENRYSVGSPGYMQAITGDKNRKPSKSDALLRTGLDFIMPSPGGVFRDSSMMVAKSLNALADRSPAVAKAMVHASHVGTALRFNPMTKLLATSFSSAQILRFAAHDMNLSPEEALLAGTKYLASRRTAFYNAVHARRAAFDYTNRDQAVEVERRSEILGGAPMQPRDVPEPTVGKTLDERAAIHRGLIKSMDDDQIAMNLIAPGRVFDPNTYTYRGGPNTYKFDQHSDVLDHWGTGSRSGKRSVKGSPDTAGAKGGHKSYEYYDQAEASGNLSSAYDPRDNFERYIKTRGERVALNSGLDDLGQMGFRREMAFHDPQTGALLGVGKEGLQQAKTLGKRRDTGAPIQAAAAEVGIAPHEITSIQRANPNGVKRMLTEVQRNIKLANEGINPAVAKVTRVEGKLADRAEDLKAAKTQAQEQAKVYPQAKADSLGAAQKAAAEVTGRAREATRASKTVSDADIGQSVARAVGGPKSPLIRREAALEKRLAAENVKEAKRVRLQDAIDKHLQAHQESTYSRIVGNAQRAEKNAGNWMPGDKVAADAKISSTLPSLAPYFSFHPDIARFLRDSGASAEDAAWYSKLTDGFNNLYRIGIIYNPVRHIFINMPMNYLASGGKLGRMVHGFITMDPEDELRAHNAGVGRHAAAQPLFGGSGGTSFDTPMGQVYREAYDKAYDLAKGDKATQQVAGFLAYLNAAGSRIWEGNQRLVFDWAENRLAVARFMEHVEDEGLSDAEASNRVSHMFGNALDMSRTGIEAGFNKAFLFYPWLRDTVPLMARALYRAPQTVWLPYSRSVDWNRATNDPRWQSMTEGTYHLGQWGGQDVYMGWLGPQKYLEDALSVFDPGGDTTQGISPRINRVANLITSELKPVPFGIPVAAGISHYQQPTEPGPPNFQTMWDNAAPPRVQLSQLTQSTLERMPFGQIIAGAVSNANRVTMGDPSTFLSALSLNTYSRPSPAIEKRQRILFDQYVKGAPGGVLGSQQINALINKVKNGPGTQPYKELRIANLQDLQMVRYLTFRRGAEMLNPGLTASQKQAVHDRYQQMIDPLNKEMRAFQAGYEQIQQMQEGAQQNRLPPGLSPAPQASPSPGKQLPPGITPL